MRAALTIAALAVLGCAEGTAHPPRIAAILPAEGANDVDVGVEITGENFEPRIHTDFNRPDQSTWNRSFTAFLVPADNGPSLELADVHLERTGVLAGTVKAGAARGFYGIRVVDSFGREGFFPEVYRVVGSPTQVAAFRIDAIGPQRPGVPFTVQLAAVDANGKVVDGFVAGVDVTTAGGAVVPTRIEPFTLGRARAQLSVDVLMSAQTLTFRDAMGRKGSSNPFAVQPGLVVELTFLSPAQTVSAGQCSKKVELETRDSFGFSAKLEAPLDTELLAAGPVTVGFFSDAACTNAISSVRVPVGDSRLAFYFRGAGTGDVVLRVVPNVLPSASQSQVVTP